MRGRADPAQNALDFGALLDRHQLALRAFLRGLVGDAELARDLTQDVYCDAWRATLRGEAPFSASAAATEGDQRNWLFHAAYCRAISARRHASVVHWESLEAGTAPLRERLEAPSRLDDDLPEQDAVRSALESLAAADAACVLLNTLYGFSAAEIGAILELAPEAAKKRLARAKQRLRAAYLAQNPMSIMRPPMSRTTPQEQSADE